jgi:HEAT repeat protein
MDPKAVEGALTEAGKVFRLSRLYPTTHPSVQQALAELAATLPAVTSRGSVELRITATGFVLGPTAIAARNPQLAELAGLLYAQGCRALVIVPGVNAAEFGALARMVVQATGKTAQTLGAHAKLQPLPHLTLVQGSRRSGPHAPPDADGAEPGPMGRQSFSVFRPDALPPDIETARILSMLELAAPAEAPRHLMRLAELCADLLARRDFGLYARAVAMLAHWSRAAAPETVAAARTAQQGLASAVTHSGLAALVARLAERAVTAGERDAIVGALGTLGARAVTAIAEEFAAAGAEHRDLMLAVVRRAGEAAVAPLLARLEPEGRGEPARALALLLGATRSLTTLAALASLARSPDPAVRAEAMAGLARLASAEAQRLVVGALRDPAPEVRIAAARGIHWFGDASVVPILLANLASEDSDDVMCALAATLGELRDPRAVLNLAEMARAVSGVFQRRTPAVRAAAVRALGAIGTADALDVAAGFRSDHNAAVRQAAEQAAGS